jgi:hypothetical protein
MAVGTFLTKFVWSYISEKSKNIQKFNDLSREGHTSLSDDGWRLPQRRRRRTANYRRGGGGSWRRSQRRGEAAQSKTRNGTYVLRSSYPGRRNPRFEIRIAAQCSSLRCTENVSGAPNLSHTPMFPRLIIHQKYMQKSTKNINGSSIQWFIFMQSFKLNKKLCKEKQKKDKFSML